MVVLQYTAQTGAPPQTSRPLLYW